MQMGVWKEDDVRKRGAGRGGGIDDVGDVGEDRAEEGVNDG